MCCARIVLTYFLLFLLKFSSNLRDRCGHVFSSSLVPALFDIKENFNIKMPVPITGLLDLKVDPLLWII